MNALDIPTQKFRKQLHDINNDLTIVVSILDLVAEDTAESPQIHRDIGQALISAMKASEKIQTLLNDAVSAS